MNDRAAVVIVRDVHILLMHRRRAEGDYYVVPGGSVEPDETPVSAGIRETEEETGLAVELGEKLCTLDNAGRMEHYFLAVSHHGELQITGPERRSPDNLYDLEWIEVDRLQTTNLRPGSIRGILADHPSINPASQGGAQDAKTAKVQGLPADDRERPDR